MRAHPLRLLPGIDLKKAIAEHCKAQQIKAGVILSGVGSLSQAQLRFATAKAGTILQGPFEIVSMTGTCSDQGLHVHLSIADSEGKVLGGHLMEGCLIYTTAEIVILDCEEHVFQRSVDPTTGYLELEIKKRSSTSK